MPRRWGIAVALSIAAHLVAVGGIFGVMLVRGLSLGGPIDVEITGMRLDEVNDLPLGPPPGGAEPEPARPRPKARRRTPKPPPGDGELAGGAPGPEDKAGTEADPDAVPEGAPERPSNLRQYGPEGSRVTVLLRLDRLRDTPYAPALDTLLARLPDRRDLLDGTGLDLYQTFDALLIATPNPLDYTVTFLAARHRLKDAELRTALERGATATGRVLTWRTEGRRPFAERHARAPASGATRDERLIVLPAPGLVVVTPPVYRALLFSTAKPRAGSLPDGGAGPPATPAPDAGGTGGTDPRWGALLRRIDAEDGIMPLDAVAMLSAVDIFSAPSLQRGLNVVPQGRALSHKLGQQPVTPGTVFGMEVPRVLTASIGIKPSPSLEVVAEFDSEGQAIHWEQDWPALHQRLRSNPYLVLTGFGSLVARAELTRTDAKIHLRLTATEAETLRLLQIVARFTGGGIAPGTAALP